MLIMHSSLAEKLYFKNIFTEFTLLTTRVNQKKVQTTFVPKSHITLSIKKVMSYGGRGYTISSRICKNSSATGWDVL